MRNVHNLNDLIKSKNITQSVINNPQGYQYLAFLSITYFCIMLFNAILTNCYVGSNKFFILGGTLTSPFVFLIDNIIAEIYGFEITKNIIIFSIIAQTVFVLLCQVILNLPHPEFFTTHHEFEHIFGWSLVRIHTSGCVAYLAAILFNTKVLTRWKVLLKGDKFWLRSLGSCAISEILYSFIAILLMEIQSIPLPYIFKVIALSYSIKLTYNFVFALPAQHIINHIREKTGIDVYDFNHKFIPSKYYNIGRHHD